jgi:mannosylglycerate hydrolase
MSQSLDRPLPPGLPERVRFLLVPHTHWDREWYLPLEVFRARLVRLLDRLLAILESGPEYAGFHLDGQTIVLEDYEQIRGKSGPLRRLLAAGRIQVGPWYILPDEFLVSGEAIIRNLERGLRVARDFGAPPARAGYLPDMFGHLAQMPQILRGFGLDRAIVWRGIAPQVQEQKFWWESPDGSRIFAGFMPIGYGVGTGLPKDPQLLRERLELIVRIIGVQDAAGAFFLFNGSDHVEPQAFVPRALDAALAGRPGWTWEFSDLARWLDALEAAGPPRASHRGEMRATDRTLILPSVASARLYLKQLDFSLTATLERYAEPLAALAQALGAGDRTGALDYAWQLLLQNNPHDSICGCSVDGVHDEMETRYHKGIQVAARIADESLAAILARIHRPSEALVVYNPAGAQAPGILSAEIAGRVKPGAVLTLPGGGEAPLQLIKTTAPERTLMDFTISRDIALLILRDLIAGEMFGQYLQRLEAKAKAPLLDLRLDLSPAPSDLDPEAVRDRVEQLLRDPAIQTIRFRVKQLPRHRVAAAIPQLAGHALAAYPIIRRKEQPTPGVTVGPDFMENESVRMQFDPGGTCLLTDKASGLGYSCLRFIDVADRGDSYNFDPLPDEPPRDEVDRVALRGVTAGPVAAVMEVRHRLRVPESLHQSRKARSRKTVTLDLTTIVTLYRGSPRVDFHTCFVNNARDHRLQAAVHAPYTAQAIRVENAFALVDRPIVDNVPAVPRPNDVAYQLLGGEGVYSTSPQKTVTLLGNGEHGLAVMNRGLAEVDACRLDGAIRVALTLVRAVGWLSRGDLVMRRGDAGPMLAAPGAQCPRRLEWDYALMPYREADGEGRMVAAAHAFAYPPRLELVPAGGRGESGHQLVRVDNPAVYVSALRPRGNEVEVRLVNASRRPERAVLTWGPWIAAPRLTDLKGDPVASSAVKISAGSAEAELAACQILTLRFKMQNG